MGNVVKLVQPDKPENVEALRAMTYAVRTAMDIGFDKKKFVRAAGDVWEFTICSDHEEEILGKL